MALIVPSDPTNPQQLLSVADIKERLRIPAAVTDDDNRLAGDIKRAAAWVSTHLSATVLDETVVDVVPPVYYSGDAGYPLLITGRRWIRDVVDVRHWSTGAELRLAPDITIQASDLGRVMAVEPGPFGDTLRVWPPRGGWPTRNDVAPGSMIEVRSNVGLDMAAPYAMLVRQAVSEGVVQLYSGYAQVRPTSKMYALLSSLTSWAR